MTAPAAMRKIGIVGGLAWPSTIAYYRHICQGANARFRAEGHPAPWPAPPIAIESVNMAETRAARGRPGDEASWAGFDAILRGCLDRLAASGCDFALIASNTPHARLDTIRQGVDLPILSIFDTTVAAAAAMGVGRALVLGTAVTMRADDYARRLTAAGIVPNAPLPDPEIDALQRLIDTEFHAGATPAGRAGVLDLCRAHAIEPRDTAVLLACTELPLAFPDAEGAAFSAEGFRFVDTLTAHADAALAIALGDRAP